jgi:hypothetical protein
MALGFRLVFCTRSPESFTAAKAEQLNVSGNPAEDDDLSRFVREQELMQQLVGESRLPRPAHAGLIQTGARQASVA